MMFNRALAFYGDRIAGLNTLATQGPDRVPATVPPHPKPSTVAVFPFFGAVLFDVPDFIRRAPSRFVSRPLHARQPAAAVETKGGGP